MKVLQVSGQDPSTYRSDSSAHQKGQRPLSNPLVSIGIPVYNGEAFLPRSLDALLAQTYDNLELVISDNASTDRTQEICLAYAARDRRITYHRSPVNIGVVANFRRVFTLSSGPYFLWAAVDDVRPPQAVEQGLEALRHDQHAVLAHGVVLVQTAGDQSLVTHPNDVRLTDTRPAARVRTFVRAMPHNAILYGLYRREALQRVVLGNCLGQDYLLSLQMCLLGPFAYTAAPMATYAERGTVASSSPMYPELPLTLSNLVRAGVVHRRKCWTVLLMAAYYLATVADVEWSDRWRAVVAHTITFGRLYRSRLTKELVFQLFQPVVWMATGLWPLVRRSSTLRRLTRKFQTPLSC